MKQGPEVTVKYIRNLSRQNNHTNLNQIQVVIYFYKATEN